MLVTEGRSFTSHDAVELEAGVMLLPQRRVVRIERRGPGTRTYEWPLPDHDLEKRLRTEGAASASDCALAATMLDAYAQMIWDDRDSRQVVIRVLRLGIEWMRQHGA